MSLREQLKQFNLRRTARGLQPITLQELRHRQKIILAV